MPRLHPQQATRGHRSIDTLDVHQLRFTQYRAVLLDQVRGGLAEHHPTRRGDRLHPLRHPDLLTDRGVTQRARTDLTGDHLTGIQSDPQLQIHTVTVSDLDGEPLGLLLNAQGRQTGANSVILQRHRRAEHRHDPVAGELVHRAAVTLHHRSGAVDQLGHDLAQPLRTRPPRRCPSNAPHRRTAPSPACTPPALAADVTGAPHSLQNLEFGGSSVPHGPHTPILWRSCHRLGHRGVFLNAPAIWCSPGADQPSRDPAAIPSVAHGNIVSPLVSRRMPYCPGDPFHRLSVWDTGRGRNCRTPGAHHRSMHRSVTVWGWSCELARRTTERLSDRGGANRRLGTVVARSSAQADRHRVERDAVRLRRGIPPQRRFARGRRAER